MVKIMERYVVKAMVTMTMMILMIDNNVKNDQKKL